MADNFKEEFIIRFGVAFKSRALLAQVLGVKVSSRTRGALSEYDLLFRLSKIKDRPVAESTAKQRLMASYAEYCQDNPQDIISNALYRYSARLIKQGA